MGIRRAVKKIIAYAMRQKPQPIVVNVAVTPPNRLLSGRTALITGGTSGIGFCIAKAFLNAGAYVIITGRTESRLLEAEKRLMDEHEPHHESAKRIYSCVLDNMQPDTFEYGFQKCLGLSPSGRIDILVNNAGILGG